MKTSDQYNKIVEWSDEDNCYIGTCPTLFDGGVHGDEEASVYNELCEVVDEWIEIYESHGEPLPEPDVVETYKSYSINILAENRTLPISRSTRRKNAATVKI